ncbi:MAG: porin [Rhodobacteraceae bacterium]|nr:porin [Paracoccaceae bacterium]
MKKVLFATTALIASAGFAAAEVSVGGSANMGFKYTDGDQIVGTGTASEDVALHWEVDFGISGSGETDTGLTFGASIDLDATVGSAGLGGADGEVFVGGAFGTVTVGNVDVATDGLGIGDVGFDGLGVDDIAETGKNVGSADMTYAYSSAGFGVVISYQSAGLDIGDTGIAATYDAGTFNVGLGLSNDESLGDQAMTISAGADLGDFGVGVTYTDNDASGAAYGISGSFDAGLAVVTAIYADADAQTDAAYGLGVAYDLGGGASLGGGFASVDGQTKMDLGINMSF